MSNNFETNKNKEGSSSFSVPNTPSFGNLESNSFKNAFQANDFNSNNQVENTTGLYGVTQNTNSDSKEIIMDIPVNVQIVLGSTTMPVAALMNLKRGSVISLDASLGDPVDIVVNGRIIAKGELVPVEDDPSRFGVSLISILNKR